MTVPGWLLAGALAPWIGIGEEPAAAPPLTVDVLVPADSPDESKGVATVGGERVRARDVLGPLFLSHTDVVYAALEQAIRRRVMMAEARAAGVVVPPELADRETERLLAAQQNEYKLAVGPDGDFEQYIEQRYGTSPAVYRAAVRDQVLEQLFLARTIRHEAMQHERMQVRVLVVEDLELARELLGKLKEGANFAALAKKHSIDRSAANEGLLAPVALDCPNPLLAGAAALEPGQLAEVEVVEKDGIKLFRLLALVARIPAQPGTFAALEAEVEKSLAERAVDPFEVAEWDRRVRPRHPIEVRLGRS
jgi:hypothetical protein